jgi:hypothetical protein
MNNDRPTTLAEWLVSEEKAPDQSKLAAWLVSDEDETPDQSKHAFHMGWVRAGCLKKHGITAATRRQARKAAARCEATDFMAGWYVRQLADFLGCWGPISQLDVRGVNRS